MSENLTKNIRIESLLKQAFQQLASLSSTPQLDASLLLSHVLGVSKDYLYVHAKEVLTQTAVEQFSTLLSERGKGYPVAYLLGYKEFWSLSLSITQDTLIPRAETELLIEVILERFKSVSMSAKRRLKVADLGTGSGAIALALAKERPNWTIIATDNDSKTLKIAQENAIRLKLNHIVFKKSDWFDDLKEKDFDLIVSNPPYIEKDDPCLLQDGIRFEPKQALVSGEDGLDDIRVLIAQARGYLKEGGILLFEHGCKQENSAKSLFKAYNYQNIITFTDLAGHPRATLGQYF